MDKRATRSKKLTGSVGVEIMSKLVLVSDLHGNAPALEKVIEREGRDKEYIILGDIHGLLAWPNEIYDLVRDVGSVVLAGNHDKAIFHHGEGHVNSAELSSFEVEYTLSQLSQEQKDWMRSLPYLKVFTDGDSRLCATHAIPWPEKASGYESGNAGVTKGSVTHIASVVSDDYDWVFHGHTHEQYSLDCSKFGHGVHFVNPGALGYGGTYASVDVSTDSVDLRSIELDTESMKDHVRNVLPDDCPSVDQWL